MAAECPLVVFKEFVKKHEIAKLKEKTSSKSSSKAKFTPIEGYFESLEGFLHLMKMYFEDTDIEWYVKIKFEMEIAPKKGIQQNSDMSVIISECGYHDFCQREMVRELYKDIIKDPRKYYLEYNHLDDLSKEEYYENFEIPRIDFLEIEEFEIEINVDSHKHINCKSFAVAIPDY